MKSTSHQTRKKTVLLELELEVKCSSKCIFSCANLCARATIGEVVKYTRRPDMFMY